MDLGGLEEGHRYITPHKRLPKFIRLLSASMTYEDGNVEVVSRIGNPHKGDPTE